MKNSTLCKATPWDAMALGMDTYEITSLSKINLVEILVNPGHYTVKVDPLSSKKILHDYGFYYCDTLLEPICKYDQFIFFDNDAVSFSQEISLSELESICREAFQYGRFHRDFNVNREHAEIRYINWLKQLHASQSVYGLYYQQIVAGFIAIHDNKLILHALHLAYRNKGLAKFFWSKVCKHLYESGCTELMSSISAANLSVLNLYKSLGFRFQNALDIYHRLVV